MTPLFLGAFPDMKTVYRQNADAGLIDFVDPDKMVVIHRRGLISYDVLIQPDILKIFRILDPNCPLQSRVDMSRKEAAAYADEARAEIRRRYPSLKDCENRKEIKAIATRIFWGTYSLFVVSRKAGINGREPYYIAIRKSITM